MSRIYADNAHSIGNTPLVQINRIAPRGVTILAKIEGRNPGYSVKCRIGANMIWDAESRGKLKPGMTIVEPTSGNTGIGLAFVAAARGYKLMLTKQLRELEDAGLISRTVFPVVPPRVDYSLTALGQSMAPVISALKSWGEAHVVCRDGVKTLAVPADRVTTLAAAE